MGPPGARLRAAARRADRDRRRVGHRKVHHLRASGALLRATERHHHRGRPRPPRLAPPRTASRPRLRRAGHPDPGRNSAGEPLPGRTGRLRGGSAGGPHPDPSGRPARTPPVRAGNAGRPPGHHSVRRRAAAHRHRPCPAPPAQGPPARRGHLAARRGQRAGAAGPGRRGGAHHDGPGGGAPAVHRHGRRPDPGHGGRTGARHRHPCGPARDRRPVPSPGRHPAPGCRVLIRPACSDRRKQPRHVASTLTSGFAVLRGLWSNPRRRHHLDLVVAARF